MVETTEREEIAEFRLTAVRPVFDVVSVDVVLMWAAREAATLVARIERTAQRSAAARFSTDVQWLAVVHSPKSVRGCSRRRGAARFPPREMSHLRSRIGPHRRHAAFPRKRESPLDADRRRSSPPPCAAGNFPPSIRVRPRVAWPGSLIHRRFRGNVRRACAGVVLRHVESRRDSLTAVCSAFNTIAPVSAGKRALSTSEPSSSQ